MLEVCYQARSQRGGGWIGGFVLPPFTQKFFNLLGLLRKIPENLPPPLKFFHTKKLKILP